MMTKDNLRQLTGNERLGQMRESEYLGAEDIDDGIEPVVTIAGLWNGTVTTQRGKENKDVCIDKLFKSLDAEKLSDEILTEMLREKKNIVLIGMPGSGKSTFLRCLNLLETPTKGEILFDNVNLTDVKTDIKNKYTNGNPYFIFIGTILMRKNLANLFRAFDIFKDSDTNGIKLVIVGSKKWWKGEIEDTYNAMKHKDDVIFMGRVKPEELGIMLSAALALTYVSFFEGFGIPILESFYAETPVITSKTTSMPEVAGDGALLADPFALDEIVCAMKQISTDSELRKQLIEKGKIQRTKFSWDLTAKKLWQSIQKTIQQ